MPNWRDLAAVVIVLAVLVLTGTGVRQVVASLTVAQQPGNSLSPIALLLYVVRIAVRGQER